MVAPNAHRSAYVLRSWQQLERRVRRYVRCDAEDVASATLIRLRERLGRWPDPVRDSALLNRAAKHSGIDTRRSFKNRNRVELDPENVIDHGVPPDKLVDLLRTLDAFNHFLKQLRAKRARVVFLITVLGYATADTAVMLGITPRTARRRLQSGIRILRRRLRTAA